MESESPAYQYTIYPEKNLVVEIWSGELTLKYMKEAFPKLLRDPNYRKELNVLSNLQDAKILMDANEMRQYTAWVIPKDRINKLAIVVSRDVDYGMARMYQAMTDSKDHYMKGCRVFNDAREAESWLESGDVD